MVEPGETSLPPVMLLESLSPVEVTQSLHRTKEIPGMLCADHLFWIVTQLVMPDSHVVQVDL